jgi:hypothetical protein
MYKPTLHVDITDEQFGTLIAKETLQKLKGYKMLPMDHIQEVVEEARELLKDKTLLATLRSNKSFENGHMFDRHENLDYGYFACIDSIKGPIKYEETSVLQDYLNIVQPGLYKNHGIRLRPFLKENSAHFVYTPLGMSLEDEIIQAHYKIAMDAHVSNMVKKMNSHMGPIYFHPIPSMDMNDRSVKKGLIAMAEKACYDYLRNTSFEKGIVKARDGKLKTAIFILSHPDCKDFASIASVFEEMEPSCELTSQGIVLTGDTIDVI